MDPEYFLTHRLTKKLDVYALGGVLLEVLCSRPAVDLGVEEKQCNLAMWAQQCIKKGALDQIIGPSLRGQISAHHLKVFTSVVNKYLYNHSKKKAYHGGSGGEPWAAVSIKGQYFSAQENNH